MPNSASYSIVEDSNDYLILQDNGPWSDFPTITNDAENIVKMLGVRLNGRRLYYFDSDGEIGELLIKDGVFAGFAFGGPHD